MAIAKQVKRMTTLLCILDFKHLTSPKTQQHLYEIVAAIGRRNKDNHIQSTSGSKIKKNQIQPLSLPSLAENRKWSIISP